MRLLEGLDLDGDLLQDLIADGVAGDDRCAHGGLLGMMWGRI
jgi:hypothetical protein